MSNGYKPSPLDLSDIKLTPGQELLVDKLAENAHNVWAKDRIKQGWTYGIQQVQYAGVFMCCMFRPKHWSMVKNTTFQWRQLRKQTYFLVPAKKKGGGVCSVFCLQLFFFFFFNVHSFSHGSLIYLPHSLYQCPCQTVCLV